MEMKTYPSDSIFIGLMSGTSVDAIDAIAVSFDTDGLSIHGTHSHPIPEGIKSQIIELNTPSENELHKAMHLDQLLGELFAEATLSLLKKSKLKAEDIVAIGSHGQTVRHQIKKPPFYTLQIGNPNTIALNTGITTVSDFRQADICVGGQGAPLTPAFHNTIFRTAQEDRVILNLGGFANVTLLWADKNKPVTGFDTGPGNVLLDTWIKKNKNKNFDNNGEWASSGKTHEKLLAQLMEETFIKAPPPKSTGRDLFNQGWLTNHLKTLGKQLNPEDIQSTLLDYTVASISDALHKWGPSTGNLYVCGGGAHNSELLKQLQNKLPKFKTETTEALDLHPDWVEAAAFAWLAKQRLNNQGGNLPSVTGAKSMIPLGSVYQFQKA